MSKVQAAVQAESFPTSSTRMATIDLSQCRADMIDGILSLEVPVIDMSHLSSGPLSEQFMYQMTKQGLTDSDIDQAFEGMMKELDTKLIARFFASKIKLDR